jgi:hypothetical protein
LPGRDTKVKLCSPVIYERQKYTDRANILYNVYFVDGLQTLSYKYKEYAALQLTIHVSSNVMGKSSCSDVERIGDGLSRGSRSVQSERVN